MAINFQHAEAIDNNVRLALENAMNTILAGVRQELEANGGTIFLDEIADMSRPLQAKLLRFLEDGSFTRVGGTQELRVDVRLLAATNRDIIQAIRDNQFREDLYHRLNVVQFRPPPLRPR